MKQLFFLFSFLCLGIVSMNGQLPSTGSTTFEGRVWDCTNDYSPLVGVKVTIYLHIDDVETGKDDVTVNSVTYTDENGFYSVTAAAALPDLRYYTITCEAEGYYTESEDVPTYYPSNVNFYMYADMGYATIHGRVIDYFTKQPISGATIEFNSSSGISIFKKTVTSGDDGLWTVQLPVSYENHYEVLADGYQPLVFGNNIINSFEDLDIELSPNQILVHLDGKVIDEVTKKPIEGLELTVRYFYEDHWVWGDEIVSITTDSEGNYSCDYYDHVIPGRTEGSHIPISITWEDKTNEFSGISGREIGELIFGLEGTYTGYGQLVIENDKPVIYHTLNIEIDKKTVSDDAGIVDGINSVKAEVNSSKHYSVSGVEISPNTKGIHIVNGKRVIVK